jgi:hypothetical protein
MPKDFSGKVFLRAFTHLSTLKILKRFIRPGWNSNFICYARLPSYDVSRIHTLRTDVLDKAFS